MLPLAFSQEKAIYEAVEGAFISIYIKKNSMETAANLINITIDASIGDLAGLEHIVTALVHWSLREILLLERYLLYGKFFFFSHSM
jgi:hypothetical protein